MKPSRTLCAFTLSELSSVIGTRFGFKNTRRRGSFCSSLQQELQVVGLACHAHGQQQHLFAPRLGQGIVRLVESPRGT